MKKAVFLDIDGVVQTHNGVKDNSIPLEGHTPVVLDKNFYFNNKCMDLLKRIKEETGAEFILSSAWRIDKQNFDSVVKTMPFLEIKYTTIQHCELPTDVYFELCQKYGCKMGRIYNCNRIIEINDFIEKHKVEKYVVIDDMYMGWIFKDKFIDCSKKGMITEELAEYAIKVLNS